MNFRILGVAAGALAAALVMSACSGGDSATTAAPGPPAAKPAAPAHVLRAQVAGQPQVLKVAELEGFSPVVVNGKGRTIYRFDKESNHPSTIACTGKCTDIWQPVLAPDGVKVKAGVKSSLVGTIERPDGGKQVTLNGWPLYYYYKDVKLGQVAGQGIGDTWFAIAPTGKKAEELGAGMSADLNSVYGVAPPDEEAGSLSGSLSDGSPRDGISWGESPVGGRTAGGGFGSSDGGH